MKQNRVKLAINLVTHNAEKYLLLCLKSLAQQTWQEFSLLIIDNGSSDGTVKYIKENYPQIKLIEHQQNVGFAKAHNQGIAWTDSNYLMLLNQDVILEKDYLEKAIKYLDKHPEVSALTGKVLVWDFQNNQKTKVIDSLGLKLYKSHRIVDFHQGEKDQGQFAGVQEVFGVSGTVPIYCRSALEQVKIDFKGSFTHPEYFDEDFFSYKEDVDLAFRLRLAELKSFYLSSCLAYHDRTVRGVPDTSSQAIKKSRKDRDKVVKIYSYKNHLLLLIKNEFIVNLLRYFFPISWYELRKLVFILLFEHSTLRGLSEFFKQKSKILKKRKYIVKNIRKINAKELAKWYE